MKTTYIQPQTEITFVVFEHHLCANTKEALRKVDWGAGSTGSSYANTEWDNQGWGDTNTPVIAGDDNGNLNSTANDNNLWDNLD